MTTVLAFIAVIGILILIHELGHFIVARVSGVGVERFSIGFGPVLWRIKGPETEYCVSAVPMGGYVKMMGDDENPLEGGTGAFDPAKAFYTKPLIVRFLIVFAGPAMNFVLAAAIFAIVFMTVGRPALPSIVGRVTEGGPASAAGLATGDRIAKVDGHPIRSWDELLDAVQDSKGAPLRLTVAGRAGDREVTVSPVRTKSRDILGDEKDAWDLGVHAYAPAVIGDTVAGSPAEKAGLQGGDTVTALDGQPIASWDEMAEAINKRAGKPTTLTVRRGSETVQIAVTPNAVKDRSPDGKEVEVGRIGVSRRLSTLSIRYNPAVAVWEGVKYTGEVTVMTARGLYKIVVGQLAPSNIGGPIQIAVAAGEQARQGLPNLAGFTAVISVNLALLNLLPVPMLDGGHLLFFLFEAVLGRPLSLRKREVAQQVGFVLLMLLMVYAFYNDLARIDVFRFLR